MLEAMKPMRYHMRAPPLQQRLTQYHGTRVPVLMLFFLHTGEVGRLARADTFFRRIVRHPMMWPGLHCRDYGNDLALQARSGVARTSHRCVWRKLHGRAVACDSCLYHMESSSPSNFNTWCKKITAIPGRSKDELMESYRKWREDQSAVVQQLKTLQAAAAEASGRPATATLRVVAPTASALPVSRISSAGSCVSASSGTRSARGCPRSQLSLPRVGSAGLASGRRERTTRPGDEYGSSAGCALGKTAAATRTPRPASQPAPETDPAGEWSGWAGPPRHASGIEAHAASGAWAARVHTRYGLSARHARRPVALGKLALGSQAGTSCS